MGRFIGFVVANVVVGVGIAVVTDWHRTTKTQLEKNNPI